MALKRGWGLLILLLLAACGQPAGTEIDRLMAQHWPDALPPLAAPPSEFTPLEASLNPAACGQCHAQQYADWQTALHSKTVGPGLLWQFKVMDQAKANRCLRCHAPLAEQKALLAREEGWPQAPSSPPPAYVNPELAHQGLVCAACHVRGVDRIGPEARGKPQGKLPHGGFKVSKLFGDSRFCAHCHQFAEDGPRVGGKLQEDTYQQWLASPYAGKQACQDCHMPERRHLWRGIHDPDMTRKAIAIDLRIEPTDDGRAQATARVTNQGAGHHFPTYMVPKVELVFSLDDGHGQRRELGRQVIGWQVDTYITRELADTRIPAGESREFSQAFEPPKGSGTTLRLDVEVIPGEHYERMFATSLALKELPEAAREPLRQALAETRAKRYHLLSLQREVRIAN